jgi:shikimate kinase
MGSDSRNIYFCGMIGSGKTTLGSRLARDLSLPFFDLDREMDRRLGYSFHRLVQEKGWVAFRELEYSICKEFAGRNRSLVCLGGGTVRYEWNTDVLRGKGLIILLTASLEELARRVRLADRPRVNVGTSLEQDLEKIWSESADKYRQAADWIYPTDSKTVDEAVDELKPRLREYLLLGKI